jgi:hypothetical protein
MRQYLLLGHLSYFLVTLSWGRDESVIIVKAINITWPSFLFLGHHIIRKRVIYGHCWGNKSYLAILVIQTAVLPQWGFAFAYFYNVGTISHAFLQTFHAFQQCLHSLVFSFFPALCGLNLSSSTLNHFLQLRYFQEKWLVIIYSFHTFLYWITLAWFCSWNRLREGCNIIILSLWLSRYFQEKWVGLLYKILSQTLLFLYPRI